MWDRLRQGEAFFLTDMELGILLQAKEIRHYHGFPLKKIPNTEEEVLQTLFHLTGKGFVKAAGDEFQVAEEIGTCLEVLKNAPGFLGIIPKEKEFPQLCAYPGKEVVTVEASAFKKGTFKIQRMSWEELEHLIRSCGSKIEMRYYLKDLQVPVWQGVLGNTGTELYLETEAGKEKFDGSRLQKEIKKTEEVLLQ